MIEQEVLNVITQVGFPVFVALWFMLRTEKVIKNNTEALLRFAEVHNAKN